MMVKSQLLFFETDGLSMFVERRYDHGKKIVIEQIETWNCHKLGPISFGHIRVFEKKPLYSLYV